jgi:hypothetical protein
MRKEAPQGNLGLAMGDLAWHAGSGLPEPTLISRLPLLLFLAQKLVHYHPDLSIITLIGLPVSASLLLTAPTNSCAVNTSRLPCGGYKICRTLTLLSSSSVL